MKLEYLTPNTFIDFAKAWIANCAITVLSIYRLFLMKYLLNVKKYNRLIIADHIKTRIFDLYINPDDNTKKVIKIPKYNNIDSLMFVFKLYKLGEFKKYSQTLKDLKHLPHISKYILVPSLIRRNGGYNTEFIEGFSLSNIEHNMIYENINLEFELSQKIISLIRELLTDLEIFNIEKGYICGDWPLHNLMYDIINNKIVNVDLEGFYTYKKNNVENSIEYIRSEYNKLINLLDKNSKDKQIELTKVVNIIRYTTTNKISYNAQEFKSGYHSIKIKGNYFRGQRECETRLNNTNYNFNHKVVLDLGCNIGGMLHQLSNKVKLGIGVDFDPKCINAANLIKSVNKENNLEFYNFNLETEHLYMIKNLLRNNKLDICFLLSMCMWIKNWKEVIDFCSNIAKDLLFESNGTKEQQNEQIQYLREKYSEIVLLNHQSNDDPLQSNRSLYLLRN